MATAQPDTGPASQPATPGWLSAPASRRAAVVVLILAVIVGVGLGWAGSGVGADDRLAVGNTGDSLSTLVRVDGWTVVIGGGTHQDALTEFVDRSTLPWQRQVHLLIVPASDDRLALGALALVERGGVGAVSVLGVPGEAPIWTRLERAAADRGIAHRYLTGDHRVALADRSELLLSAPSPDVAGSTSSTALLRHGQVHVLIVEGGETPAATKGRLVDGEVTAMVQIRPGDPNEHQPAAVMLRPEPQRPSAVAADPPLARFVGEIGRGVPLTVELEPDTLRLPIDLLRPVNQATPSGTR